MILNDLPTLSSLWLAVLNEEESNSEVQRLATLGRSQRVHTELGEL